MGPARARDAFPAPPMNRPDAATNSPRASRAATTAPATLRRRDEEEKEADEVDAKQSRTRCRPGGEKIVAGSIPSRVSCPSAALTWTRSVPSASRPPTARFRRSSPRGTPGRRCEGVRPSGSRVWKILTGVARPLSNAAASSDVDDENTAVMEEDSMTAGGVLGGGVMGSGISTGSP